MRRLKSSGVDEGLDIYFPEVNPLSFYSNHESRKNRGKTRQVPSSKEASFDYIDENGLIRTFSDCKHVLSGTCLQDGDASVSRKSDVSLEKASSLGTDTRIITSLDAEKIPGLFDRVYIAGPWYVFLFVNMDENTSIRIHTVTGISNMQLNEIERMFNDRSLNPYTQTHKHVGKWVLILAATGFQSWEQTKNFYYTWNYKTRGPVSRTMMGIAMYNRYRNVHPWLKMYSVGLSKDEKLADLELFAN